MDQIDQDNLRTGNVEAIARLMSFAPLVLVFRRWRSSMRSVCYSHFYQTADEFFNANIPSQFASLHKACVILWKINIVPCLCTNTTA